MYVNWHESCCLVAAEGQPEAPVVCFGQLLQVVCQVGLDDGVSSRLEFLRREMTLWRGVTRASNQVVQGAMDTTGHFWPAKSTSTLAAVAPKPHHSCTGNSKITNQQLCQATFDWFNPLPLAISSAQPRGPTSLEQPHHCSRAACQGQTRQRQAEHNTSISGRCHASLGLPSSCAFPCAYEQHVGSWQSQLVHFLLLASSNSHISTSVEELRRWGTNCRLPAAKYCQLLSSCSPASTTAAASNARPASTA